MSGLTWLNDLMTWLARWVPRLTLIKATHQGVMFGPNGRVSLRMPGLLVYWPITHELVQVSTRLRTMELAAQIHDREAIQVVISYRIAAPVTALMAVNDVAAQMDDRAQAALCAAYGPVRPSDEIAACVKAKLVAEWQPLGIIIEGVDVSQRGPTFTLKMLNDWAVHENRAL